MHIILYVYTYIYIYMLSAAGPELSEPACVARREVGSAPTDGDKLLPPLNISLYIYIYIIIISSPGPS